MSENIIDSSASGVTFFSGIKRDFIYGLSTLLIAGTALGIYLLGAFLGTIGPADVSISILLISSAGVFIAQFLKITLTGKWLTPAEVFQNALIAGLLAATSSGQALFQAPATWTQMIMKSNLTVTIAFLIYFTANARTIAVKGRHLKAVSGALIAGTPYLFGWLLVLSNQSLLRALSAGVSAGLLSLNPFLHETIGRLIVVFVFTEVAVGAVRLAVKGDFLKSLKAHLYLFLVSLAIVLSPLIADAGSGSFAASLPLASQGLLAVLLAAISHAPLWGITYLLTGMILDAVQGTAPSEENIKGNISNGMRKGLAFSGIVMALLYLMRIVLGADSAQFLMTSLPLVVGLISGAVVFPLIKTIIETFDGTKPFFIRLRYSYRNTVLYARGGVFGVGMAYGIGAGVFGMGMAERIPFGLFVGLASSVGVSFIRDAVYSLRGQGKMQSWRLYFVDALLGGFVGSAIAFYLDSAQVPVVLEKFRQYTTAGSDAQSYITYPLLNKWGMIDLGVFTGGVKLFYTEAFAGVLNWSVAAWLFAVNRVFMEAYFKKDRSIIKNFFSKEGAQELVKHLVRVMRWGLWMAPIIFTFLRMMPEPTWYNQDGLVRTFFAVFQRTTLSSEAFTSWSLNVFLYILVYDFFRILIWVDHMGLRVATLVNWSFLGLDRLDLKVARFIGPGAAQRHIPEAIRRFATWAPLLIPFYMPSGDSWEYLWVTSQSTYFTPIHHVIAGYFGALSIPQTGGFLLLSAGMCTGSFSLMRLMRLKAEKKKKKKYEITSGNYSISVNENGSIHSSLRAEKYLKAQAETHVFEYDITRRSYDIIDPCGRSIFIVDADEAAGSPSRFWPVTGNFPENSFPVSTITRKGRKIITQNLNNGIRTTIELRAAGKSEHAEMWTITIENTSGSLRKLKVVPYTEWVLNQPNDDRFHPQYSKLFPELEYIKSLNATLAWQKKTNLTGFMAADIPPEGFLSYRLDFIGRARSIWDPYALGTLDFKAAQDTDRSPSFDPIGSFIIDAALESGSSFRVNMLIGCAGSRDEALKVIKKYLNTEKGA